MVIQSMIQVKFTVKDKDSTRVFNFRKGLNHVEQAELTLLRKNDYYKAMRTAGQVAEIKDPEPEESLAPVVTATETAGTEGTGTALFTKK